ncbi:uncharacterized protein DNG_05261 [Cephalotrichum gorgonifer]|uniref:Stig1 domain-containing protein n=1 Tax=Cephalotrichum gorgonifer TaxID=2041049 RepID=A0AAE8N048_9PEZI|nr:uncharacterized protein DNG_05261 [Cephalotrichum gorgonifer]
MVAYHRLALGFLATAVLSSALPTDSIDKCAVVRCTAETECAVIDGVARCVPIELEKCGTTTCPRGTTCCNALCNICTKPGMACPMGCAVPEPEPVKCGPATCEKGDVFARLLAEFCGPVEGRRDVPEPEEDIDEPEEPEGEECGPNTCAKGQTCCNESCGICVAPGEACTEQFCLPTGPQCGPTQCWEGETCCNSSCGYCTKPGEGCTKEFCDFKPLPEPEGEKCGSVTCDKGDVCCNDSCSICTPPGGACTMQLCAH